MRISGLGMVAVMLLAFVALPAVSVAPSIASFTFYTHASEIDLELCGDASGFNTFKPSVKWKSFPVEYMIVNDGGFGAEIREALGDWDDITDRAFFAETAVDEDVKVDFASIDGPGKILAQATVWWTVRGKAIVYASVIFDADDDWAALALDCAVSAPPFDIGAVASHEFGHVIGLAHFDDPAMTMNTFYVGAKGQTLASGDIEGFAKLYDEHGAGGGDDNGGGKPKKCHPVFGC